MDTLNGALATAAGVRPRPIPVPFVSNAFHTQHDNETSPRQTHV